MPADTSLTPPYVEPLASHEDLLRQFLNSSDGNISSALQAMLTLRRSLTEQVEALNAELVEGEASLQNRTGSAFAAGDYDAIAEHLKIMCPSTAENMAGGKEPSNHYLTRASKDVPWLRPLIKNGVFEPTHFVDAPGAQTDEEHDIDFDDAEDTAVGSGSSPFRTKVHDASAPSTAAGTPTAHR